MILTGDCIEVMAGMEPDSVDAIVTDPPYGLEFMGKEWDKFAVAPTTKRSGWDHTGGGGSAMNRRDDTAWKSNGVNYHKRRETNRCKVCGKRDAFRNDHGHGDQWIYEFVDDTPIEAMTFQAWCEAWGREALRVTKPGGYLLAFGGTRTHHRLVCGLEDAGWIIRDELDWIYASGFPKGKANLKPAHEPIVLARKPGPLRPLAIDECRIPGEPWQAHDATGLASVKFFTNGETPVIHKEPHNAGRWPSNVLLSDRELFDQPTDGVVGSGAVSNGSPLEWHRGDKEEYGNDFHPRTANEEFTGYGDSGGYSRFFVIPKADRADREPVLRGQLAAEPGRWGGTINDNRPHMPEGYEFKPKPRENSHPTVKPTDLMRHLVRLVTPIGGTVLDCFLGSGSTAIAAEMEGFAWIGIEKEPEYVAIAEARLNGVQRGLGLDLTGAV